jgi:hypothetical protein
MKRILSLSAKLTALFAVFQLTACHKLIDKYFPDNNKEKVCRITEIKQPDPVDGGTFRTGTFYYNHKGNPDSVIFDEGFAVAKLHYFYYGQNHKLVAYDSYYDEDPENFYTKHKYVYENGRIVRDTAWIRVAGLAVIVSSFTYDNSGRIIREDQKLIEADGQPMNEVLDPIIYNYDADGNLEKNGVQYDDKVSFYRTNSVWMFIERNYSLNNPVGASGYNNYGLPTGFGTTNDVKFLGYDEPSVIEYQCK